MFPRRRIKHFEVLLSVGFSTVQCRPPKQFTRVLRVRLPLCRCVREFRAGQAIQSRRERGPATSLKGGRVLAAPCLGQDSRRVRALNPPPAATPLRQPSTTAWRALARRTAFWQSCDRERRPPHPYRSVYVDR